MTQKVPFSMDQGVADTAKTAALDWLRSLLKADGWEAGTHSRPEMVAIVQATTRDYDTLELKSRNVLIIFDLNMQNGFFTLAKPQYMQLQDKELCEQLFLFRFQLATKPEAQVDNEG